MTWVHKKNEDDGTFGPPQPCVDLAYAACLGYVECDPPTAEGVTPPVGEIVAPRRRNREREVANG